MKIRILLADDQQLMRDGLRMLLEMESDLEIIAEAENGRQTVDAFCKFRPDIVLMDIEMPFMGGIESTRQICEKYADAKIIILTTFENDDYIKAGLEAGATGFLLKAVSGKELAENIRTVMAGGSVLAPGVASKVIALLAKKTEASVFVEPLNEREMQVLQLIASGCSNKEISSKLELAQGTVKNYVTNILQKMNVRDRLQAVYQARKSGIIH